ncbi:MAG: hypothetical protein IPI35_26500 [Deltaproteobacteria bacterium]|nr:hypothetical protein [Deltaproteobacteria bacterium]
MPRVLLAALVFTSCAAEVPPRADAGDPRVIPVGATAALDGSFSEGDGLSYAWAVTPEGATLLDAESPFATLIAEAPGLYTLSLRGLRRVGPLRRRRDLGAGGRAGEHEPDLRLGNRHLRRGRERRGGAG